MRFRSLFVATVILALPVVGGCVTSTNAPQPGATTQPVVVTTTLDPQAVKFFADLAVNDALLYVASDPKLQKYVDAALKAKADLDNADPAAPTYQKYVKAVNDATFDLILHAGKVKAAKKAVSQAAVSPGIVLTKITVPDK